MHNCRKSLLVSHPRPLIVHHGRGPWKKTIFLRRPCIFVKMKIRNDGMKWCGLSFDFLGFFRLFFPSSSGWLWILELFVSSLSLLSLVLCIGAVEWTIPVIKIWNNFRSWTGQSRADATGRASASRCWSSLWYVPLWYWPLSSEHRVRIAYCIIPLCWVTLAPPPQKQIGRCESNKPIRPKLTFRQSINQSTERFTMKVCAWLIDFAHFRENCPPAMISEWMQHNGIKNILFRCAFAISIAFRVFFLNWYFFPSFFSRWKTAHEEHYREGVPLTLYDVTDGSLNPSFKEVQWLSGKEKHCLL